MPIELPDRSVFKISLSSRGFFERDLLFEILLNMFINFALNDGYFGCLLKLSGSTLEFERGKHELSEFTLGCRLRTTFNFCFLLYVFSAIYCGNSCVVVGEFFAPVSNR